MDELWLSLSKHTQKKSPGLVQTLFPCSLEDTGYLSNFQVGPFLDDAEVGSFDKNDKYLFGKD